MVCLFGCRSQGLSFKKKTVNARIVTANLIGFTNFIHTWYINCTSFNTFKEKAYYAIVGQVQDENRHVATQASHQQADSAG